MHYISELFLETRNGVLYDLQSKKASTVWKSPQSPRKRKFCRDRSKQKVMLEVFFDIHGNVHLESIPEERNVNKNCLWTFCIACVNRSERRDQNWEAS
ncbi:hypothetical protein TNCV_2789381 [Trichonephila clavipes]|nr:hypothetical protein TNCV_2789381 [Trichonephila clavipes]